MGFLSSIGGVIGGAIGGPVGSLIGGGLGSLGDSALGSSGAKSSASTQANAATSAANAQLAQYAQTRNDQMPWLAQGGGAVNQLGYLMGVNSYMPQTAQKFQMPADKTGSNYNTLPTGSSAGVGPNGQLTPVDNKQTLGTSTPTGTPWAPNTAEGAFGSLAKPFSMADYQADPGYAFRLQQGQQALERSQAAKGGLLSGGAAKAMDAYSQGQASQEYQSAFDRYNTNQTNLYNRLAGLSGTGQTSASNLGQQGTQAANNYGTGIQNAGLATANGQNQSNAYWTTGLNQIGQSLGGSIGSGLFGGGGNANVGLVNWNGGGSSYF